jgi:hypothetical protein
MIFSTDEAYEARTRTGLCHWEWSTPINTQANPHCGERRLQVATASQVTLSPIIGMEESGALLAELIEVATDEV